MLSLSQRAYSALAWLGGRGAKVSRRGLIPISLLLTGYLLLAPIMTDFPWFQANGVCGNAMNTKRGAVIVEGEVAPNQVQLNPNTKRNHLLFVQRKDGDCESAQAVRFTYLALLLLPLMTVAAAKRWPHRLLVSVTWGVLAIAICSLIVLALWNGPPVPLLAGSAVLIAAGALFRSGDRARDS